jgi:hypothetical protein
MVSASAIMSQGGLVLKEDCESELVGSMAADIPDDG